MIVRVALGERAYDVHIASGLLARAGEIVAPLTARKHIAVVTDSTVARLHLEPLRTALTAAGLTIAPIIVSPGEATKNWRTLETVVESLLGFGVERGDVVVALGGGVVGDLTGFAAAILRRGCKFVQIPTTLLAQVDSSVGGKTAINATAGKNLVGAFHQPAAVLIDPSLLDTLPPRELRAGYAEVVKTALLGDAAFFDWCDANVAALLGGDPAARTHAIATSVAAKAAIVAADERETGDTRALLNLGHTFGHALEAEAGFSDRLLHGEAVAIGCALAFAFSAERGLCPPADAARVADHLARAGLPNHPRGIATTAAPLMAHMLQDKKMRNGTLAFVLARGIGDAFIARDIPLGEVETFLDRTLAA
ncbi:3-dehydroquinate synthase [Polymorphobacter sp. PAMC 29334]|uniref:3-dehydroquinate synthase n=1 Tax=Polymorphobacter sp. PAMC 29334 TaxID=2862331 RepID=UPI001C7669E6|nr:3-dehydroquinate synthase [Polymorphobacter sp. PAMC 29334]QYE35862.1 3-dehydroquinate synthase [Polymorphobacter sp. PAMC 29334]